MTSEEYEAIVRKLEDLGAPTSDAQSVVDAAVQSRDPKALDDLIRSVSGGDGSVRASS